MKAKQSGELQLNPFEFIKVGESYENIADIMRFCGVPESRLDDEICYFDNGDVFIFTDANGIAICIGDDISVRPGDFIVKRAEGVYFFEQRVIDFFFILTDQQKECSA